MLSICIDTYRCCLNFGVCISDHSKDGAAGFISLVLLHISSSTLFTTLCLLLREHSKARIISCIVSNYWASHNLRRCHPWEIGCWSWSLRWGGQWYHVVAYHTFFLRVLSHSKLHKPESNSSGLCWQSDMRISLNSVWIKTECKPSVVDFLNNLSAVNTYNIISD
jgi:hypothetical protein